MIQAEVEYWVSHERPMIEEYAREKAEADIEADAIIIDKAKGIERARAEAEANARDEDDMRKQAWREKSFGLKSSKNSKAETRGVKPETKIVVSKAQARTKTESDIRGTVRRKRAAAKAKTKANP